MFHYFFFLRMSFYTCYRNGYCWPKVYWRQKEFNKETIMAHWIETVMKKSLRNFVFRTTAIRIMRIIKKKPRWKSYYLLLIEKKLFKQLLTKVTGFRSVPCKMLIHWSIKSEMNKTQGEYMRIANEPFSRTIVHAVVIFFFIFLHK